MSKHESHDDMGHGDRPWVFFMIDCFFMIVQFYVLTFKIKTGEVILPQKMPPGGTVPSKTVTTEQKKIMYVGVSRPGGTTPVYEFMTKRYTLSELSGILAGTVGSGQSIQVRVSYEGSVPWGDVLAVFNECTKSKINECGLVPLRGIDPPGGRRS